MSLFRQMKYRNAVVAAVLGACAIGAAGAYALHFAKAEPPDLGALKIADEVLSTTKAPSREVQVVGLKDVTAPSLISANGVIHAWQNASISAEVGGLLVKEVFVSVGDKVKKGQVLVSFNGDTIAIEVKQQEANLAEARANLGEAKANAQRARLLAKASAVSEQDLLQATTQELSAQARVTAAEASLHYQQLRLEKTRIVAPDSGTISARFVTVGQVISGGTELFRYIQGDKLEWHAELSAESIMTVSPGQPVTIKLADQSEVRGKVRQVSPSLNQTTRNGFAYVELETGGKAKPGMYVPGLIQKGRREARTVDASAVVNSMGTTFLMAVDGESRVQAHRVTLGAAMGNEVEVLTELDEGLRFVAKGAALLVNGELVAIRP